MASIIRNKMNNLRCEIISPGISRGRLLFISLAVDSAPSYAQSDEFVSEREIHRFSQQVESLIKEMQNTVNDLEANSMSAQADIIRTHIAMLKDTEFHKRVHEAIRDAKLAAEHAVEKISDEIVRFFRSSNNPVFIEKAGDIRDIAEQLRIKLLSKSVDHVPSTASETILVIQELLPSIVLEAHKAGAKAFIVERGTALSHGAILAKSFGIPVVRVPDIELLRAYQGVQVLVDGNTGEILTDAAEEEYHNRLQSARQVILKTSGKLLARLWVSIMDPAQLKQIDWNCVEGVGLYRTEMLFMQKTEDFPSEEEQMEVYGSLFEIAGGRPVSIRTADIGADKPVQYLSLGPQDNPYLGIRAHRLFRFHPQLIITQIRAILRAAYKYPLVRIMYPMIETFDQWRFIQGLVNQAITSLQKEGKNFLEHFRQCILIETPSAVWDYAALLKEFDYASVGTNDLVQFLFAVERNNLNLTDLYQPEHPVFLRILQSLAKQSHLAGKPLAICGEMAGDAALTAVLVGLGLTDFSVSPASLEMIKQQLGSMTQMHCVELAQACTAARTGEEVRSLLGKRTGTAKIIDHADKRKVDPICGMVVHTKDNPWTIEDDGVRYYFCSRIHMLRFINKIGNDVD